MTCILFMNNCQNNITNAYNYTLFTLYIIILFNNKTDYFNTIRCRLLNEILYSCQFMMGTSDFGLFLILVKSCVLNLVFCTIACCKTKTWTLVIFQHYKCILELKQLSFPSWPKFGDFTLCKMEMTNRFKIHKFILKNKAYSNKKIVLSVSLLKFCPKKQWCGGWSSRLTISWWSTSPSVLVNWRCSKNQPQIVW